MHTSSVQFSHSVVSDSATPWTAARQASLSITNSWSLLKLVSIETYKQLPFQSSGHLDPRGEKRGMWLAPRYGRAKVCAFEEVRKSLEGVLGR